MQIDIESEELTTKNKRDGSGTYQVQSAYAHLVENDGSPQRYPRQVTIFPNRDPAGNAVAYKKGKYELSDSSFRVANNGYLEIGFVNLQLVKG